MQLYSDDDGLLYSKVLYCKANGVIGCCSTKRCTSEYLSGSPELKSKCHCVCVPYLISQFIIFSLFAIWFFFVL